MNVSDAKRIFIIGVKGAGTSAIANILTKHGKFVVGSDSAEEFFTDAILKKAGVKVYEFGETKSFTEFDIVIHSTAFNETNPDIAQAKSERITLLPYPQALGEVIELFSTSIAIAGSHGKSTITSLLSWTLEQGGKDPSALIGAEVVNWQSNARMGGKDFFVFEADEYQNKFQYYNPKIIVITNLSYEHPDFFPDMASYTKVFSDFIAKIPRDGMIVANYDHDVVRSIVSTSGKDVIWYGKKEGADIRLTDRKLKDGKQELIFMYKGKIKKISLALIGEHNALNALPVYVLADYFRVDDERIKKAFKQFKGTHRRLQIIGEKNDILVVDDYAHHPVEIRASLSSLREAYPARRIVCVFQPHTYTRTKALLTEFGPAFTNADVVVLMSIFGSAREKQGGVTIEDVMHEVKKYSDNVSTVLDVKAALAYLQKNVTSNELVVTMGAGDTWQIARDFVK